MSDNIFSEFDFEPDFKDTTPLPTAKAVYRPPSGFIGMSLGQTAIISMLFFFTVSMAGTMMMVAFGKMKVF